MITPTQSFKIGDLEDLFPDGMFLHRKYDTSKHLAIYSISETWNEYLASSNTLLVNIFLKKFNFVFQDKVGRGRKQEEKQKKGAKARDTMNIESDEGVEKLIEEYKKKKEEKESKSISKMPLLHSSSKKLVQIKKTGATKASLKESQSAKKAKKPEKGYIKEEVKEEEKDE